MAKLKDLLSLLSGTNLCSKFSNEDLASMGSRVVDEAEIDDETRKEWLKDNKKSMDHAMQLFQEKNEPWPKAANIKYPTLTTAAIQFHARAYPAIITGNQVVKSAVIGKDANGVKSQAASRVAAHMNYQLLFESDCWEEDMDRLLIILPIVGCAFKKTFRDKRNKMNKSILVRAEDCIINYAAKDIRSVPRITERFKLYPHEIESLKLTGVYRDVDFTLHDTGNDPDELQEMYEQHRYEDINKDGIKEPVIVTVHKESNTVLRIDPRFNRSTIMVRHTALSPDEMSVLELDTAVNQANQSQMKVQMEAAKEMGYQPEVTTYSILDPEVEVIRIEPVHHYTKYPFIPSPDGGFYDIGFGKLLGTLGDAVDTIINQMLDNASVSNTGGGFYQEGIAIAGKKAGNIKFSPGEYKPVKVPTGITLDKAIVPFTPPAISQPHFNLLTMLITSSKDITSVKDILTGDDQGANTPVTTTLARIEQGLKVFTAIHKRIHRSLKDESYKIFMLNKTYTTTAEYFAMQDDEFVVNQTDYAMLSSNDVRPVSDPGMVTETQRMTKAQALMAFAMDPMFDGLEVRKRYLEALGIEDIPKLLKGEPQMDPQVQAMMQQAEQVITQLQEELKKAQDQTSIKLAELQQKERLSKEELALKKSLAAVDIELKKAQMQLDAQSRQVENAQKMEFEKWKVITQTDLEKKKHADSITLEKMKLDEDVNIRHLDLEDKSKERKEKAKEKDEEKKESKAEAKAEPKAEKIDISPITDKIRDLESMVREISSKVGTRKISITKSNDGKSWDGVSEDA